MRTFRHFYMFMIKQVLAFKKMQATPISIPTSGTVFRGDLVMKTFLRPFIFRWFKKSSCQLLVKECTLSTEGFY